jgi:hypothetical protein
MDAEEGHSCSPKAFCMLYCTHLIQSWGTGAAVLLLSMTCPPDIKTLRLEQILGRMSTIGIGEMISLIQSWQNTIYQKSWCSGAEHGLFAEAVGRMIPQGSWTTRSSFGNLDVHILIFIFRINFRLVTKAKFLPTSLTPSQIWLCVTLCYPTTLGLVRSTFGPVSFLP